MKKPPSNGPATEASPKAAPMSPMKRPRSRGGTTSAMIAWTPIISPPPPTPWRARKAISSSMVRDQLYQRGADDEHDDRELEDALAPEEVAELSVDREPDGGGEQIGGDRPGHLLQAVQLTDDLRERGGDDHLVERREQQREHQPDEDEPDAARVRLEGGRHDRGQCRRGWNGRGRGRFGRPHRRGVARTVGLVLHQSDPTHHVPLPSSRMRRPFLASRYKGGQTRRGALTAHSEGLSPGESHYGAQPGGWKDHPNR